ncbi:MAG: nucleoside triphosphate pyrophosphohydrolase [Chloroflexi bacterium]|nr:nucleoside triphosphate pyrophosphohydrolase [Chloroflexota bacterium]
MSNQQPEDLGTYHALEQVVARLLAPGGCPWDREQTHQSLKRNHREECYELIEAIDSDDPENMAEELGDILVQVAFHIRLAQEAGRFGPQEVFTAINEKLIRRHPHVFGDGEARTSEEVKAHWEAIKQQEKQSKEGKDTPSRLDGVPRTLPALAYAQLVQDRASLAGFDWDRMEGVLDKVYEEVKELKEAASQDEREHELGDLLFTLVNTGRWLGLQTEDTLRHANQRFYRRFAYMEGLCRGRGIEFTDLTMDEKEALWQEAKTAVG